MMGKQGGWMILHLLSALLVLASLQSSLAANPKLTDKLVLHIQKKSYDAFVAELSKEDMDVNQPDSKGRLPLVEAVRTKDIRFVDALIQYGALAKSKDPATGTTPIHIAFQQNLPAIARLLLAYGADINVDDKTGKKAREFSPSIDIRKLIDLHDKHGVMAFEDEPGVWIRDYKNKDKKEGAYWFNIKTNESRWNSPPSCAWHRMEVQGHPATYVNAVTGQDTHEVPAALAWARVRYKGKEMWYNWKANVSQVETPEEVPEEILKAAEKNINVRWYNSKTNEFSWLDPNYHTPWREVKDESGRTYYYNIATGDSSWDLPTDLAWVVQKDDASGKEFYFNKQTGESTWDAPNHMSWVRHDTDL